MADFDEDGNCKKCGWEVRQHAADGKCALHKKLEYCKTCGFTKEYHENGIAGCEQFVQWV